MIRFILACWDLSSLPVQIGCTEHIMTITRSGRKYFAGGVNPHEENFFGVLIETFGTLNLNNSGRYYQRTQCTDEQERPRSDSRPRWLSWMCRPTGDQEVAGSTPAEVGNILSWRLIMKYFLRSFSPFR